MKEIIDPKKKKLTLKEASFVALYTDPHSPSFGNGTQSYLNSYPQCTSRMTASTEASRMMRKPHVREAVRLAQEITGYSQKVRQKRLEEVLNGSYTSITTDKLVRYKDLKDKDGSIKKVPVVMMRERTTTPKAAEIISAANILNKMDGTYNEAKAASNLLNAELQAIFKNAHKAINGKKSPLVAEIKGKLPQSAQKHGVYTDVSGKNGDILPLREEIDGMMRQAKDNIRDIISKGLDPTGGEIEAEDQAIESGIDTQEADSQEQREQAEAEASYTLKNTAQGPGSGHTGEGGAGASPSIKIAPSPTTPNFPKNPFQVSKSGLICPEEDEAWEEGGNEEEQAEIQTEPEESRIEEELEKNGVEAYGLNEEELFEELRAELC